VRFFKCDRFTVAFEGEPAEEEEGEVVSTDVRGFVAPNSDDDDEDDYTEDRLARQHSRAFGAPMPLLNPKAKTPEKKD